MKTTKTGDMRKSTGVRKKVLTYTAVLCSVAMLAWLSSKSGKEELTNQDYHSSPIAGATASMIDQVETESLMKDSSNGDEGESKVKLETKTVNKEKKKEKKEKKPKYKFNQEGYTTALHGLNVRKRKTSDSKVIEVRPFASQIKYAKTEKDGWYAVKCDNMVGYISSEFVSSDDILGDGVEYACYNDTRSPFMSWRTITATNTNQYKMQNWYASTAYNGVRVVNDRYCTAIGQVYGAPVGQYFDAVLADGTVIPCIVADAKRWQDTSGGAGYCGYDGGYVEYVVETSALPSYSRMTGDCKDIPGWEAPVVKLIIYDVNIFG